MISTTMFKFSAFILAKKTVFTDPSTAQKAVFDRFYGEKRRDGKAAEQSEGRKQMKNTHEWFVFGAIGIRLVGRGQYRGGIRAPCKSKAADRMKTPAHRRAMLLLTRGYRGSLFRAHPSDGNLALNCDR